MSFSNIQTQPQSRSKYVELPLRTDLSTLTGSIISEAINLGIFNATGGGGVGTQGFQGYQGTQGIFGTQGLIGPTGPSGGGASTVEIITGSQLLDPNINTSVINSGLIHVLPNGNTDGTNKIIIDNINKNIVNMTGIANWFPSRNIWSNVGSGLLSVNRVSVIEFDGLGNIYMGGEFFIAGGISVNNIVKYNISNDTWSTLGVGVNNGVKKVSGGQVWDIKFDIDGNLIIGGLFDIAGGISANNIAKYDPINNTWSSLGVGVDSRVSSIIIDTSNNLYVGGYFTTAGGISSNLIAKWDTNTNTWSSIGSVLDGFINVLLFDSNGNIYMGGGFSVSGTPYFLAKYEPTTAIWSYYIPSINGGVYSMIIDSSDNIYVGTGSVTLKHIFKWNSTTNTYNTLGLGTNSNVTALALDTTETYLYVGGTFTQAGGVIQNRLALWNTTTNTWDKLTGGLNKIVQVIKFYNNDNIYIGGSFTQNTSQSLIINGNFTNFTALSATYNNTTLTSSLQGKNIQLIYLSSINSWVPVNTQYSTMSIS